MLVTLFKLGFWGSAAAIAAFSLLPLGNMLPALLIDLLPFDLRSDAPGSDKFWHFVAYAVCGFCAQVGYRSVRSAAERIAGLWLYGFLMEFLQALIPDRFMSGLDIVANGAGVLAGSAAAVLAALLFLSIAPTRDRSKTPG